MFTGRPRETVRSWDVFWMFQYWLLPVFMSWGCSRWSAQRSRSCVWQQLIFGKEFEEDVVLLTSDYVMVCNCPADRGDRMAVRKFARWMWRERSWMLFSAELEASVSVWAVVLSWNSMQLEARLVRDRSGHAGVCWYSPLTCRTGVSCNNPVEKWGDRGRSSWQIRESDLGEHVGEHGCGSSGKYATEIMSTQLHACSAICDWVKRRLIIVSYVHLQLGRLSPGPDQICGGPGSDDQPYVGPHVFVSGEGQWPSGRVVFSEPGGPGFDSTSWQPQVVAHQHCWARWITE